MISAPVGVLSGPEDHPGRSRGLPDASRTLQVPKTSKFLRFLRSEELLSQFSEIFHRLPRDGHNVCISLEIVMVGAIMCSRLQPQPHYARGTVQHPSVGVPAPQCRGASTPVSGCWHPSLLCNYGLIKCKVGREHCSHVREHLFTFTVRKYCSESNTV